MQLFLTSGSRWLGDFWMLPFPNPLYCFKGNQRRPKSQCPPRGGGSRQIPCGVDETTLLPGGCGHWASLGARVQLGRRWLVGRPSPGLLLRGEMEVTTPALPLRTGCEGRLASSKESGCEVLTYFPIARRRLQQSQAACSELETSRPRPRPGPGSSSTYNSAGT